MTRPTSPSRLAILDVLSGLVVIRSVDQAVRAHPTGTEAEPLAKHLRQNQHRIVTARHVDPAILERGAISGRVPNRRVVNDRENSPGAIVGFPHLGRAR